MARYSKIKTYDISNGRGLRTSIFFSGCPIHCKGCFNQELWNPNVGQEYTEKTYQEIKDSMNEHIDGLSILGGEPLSDYNLSTVIKLCKEFNKDFPTKSIFLWTGYEIEDFTEQQKEVLNYIHVLVCGPFVEELKDLNLKMRGSSNQRVLPIRYTIFKE